MDGLLIYNWYLALIPAWIALGIAFVLSIGLLILVISSINTYASNETSLKELLGLAWLFATSAGFSMSFWYCFHSLAVGDPLISSVLPVTIFLSAYLVICIPCFDYLVSINEVIMIGERRKDISVIKVAKDTPKFMVQVSSTFFRELEENQTIEQTEEVRESVCSICCERDSNAVLMDCRHGGFCYECAITTWKRKKSCPLCRSSISEVLEIEGDEEGHFRVVSVSKMEVVLK